MKSPMFHRSGGDGPRRSPRPQGGPSRKSSGPIGSFPLKNLALWVLLILIALLFMIEMSEKRNAREEISYNTFLEQIDSRNLKSVTFLERKVTGELKTETSLEVNGRAVPVKQFEALLPTDNPQLPQQIHEKDKTVQIHGRKEGSIWPTLLTYWLPAIMIIVFWLFVLRQMQAGGSTAMKFGKSKAKLLIENHPKVTFKDVAGCDEAKAELEEVIEFLKEPQKFQRLGGRIPRGALLLGPPGTGKTLLAKAVAGEAGVPFFSMSGSDFVEMFVGVGASVTGDTPVLVRRDGATRLMPIAEFVDGFYADGEADRVVPVEGAQTLGFREKDSKFKGGSKTFVDGSAWVSMRGVYRHRVSEICEIRYLGGVLRTTADHSVFVRTRDGIKPVAARDLKPGAILVNLPFKVRGACSKELGTPHTVRSHAFQVSGSSDEAAAEAPVLRLPLQEIDAETLANYRYAVAQRGAQPQAAIAAQIGVSQMTVSNWQRGRHLPQAITPDLVDVDLPDDVELSNDLLRVLGYYTAEGRVNGCVEFTFGSHETDLHADCIEVMERLFGVKAKVRPTDDNSTKITFHSAPLGRFFEKHCGTGSRAKRVPEFLWDLPREQFEAYLTGYALGDGYTTKEGKLSMTSVSHRLIQELTWLCAMHGIKAGVDIRDQGKRPIVREVLTLPYEGYVYDLCGCEHEAFFGGEKPMLLHNSRVRDLFDQGKKNAPCITGDSVITLSDGRQVTIGEMFERQVVGVRVPAMTDDFRLEDATVIGITRKPCTDLLRITTGASSIRATGNHLFPVLRGAGMEWVRADRLSEADQIAMPKGTMEPGSSRPTSPRFDCELEGGVATLPLIASALESPDILWSKIRKIERVEPVDYVYDLCLDKHHCFVANNMVVHNCIIFIDEIDAVGRHRGAGLGGGHDEREQTLNQLLVEMDGFDSSETVILLAATNRPDVLDPALLRPGRFDRQIVVDWPDVRGREGILKVHARNIPLENDVKLEVVAKGTPGMSGADLANLVNEAALLAARRNKKKVSMRDFEDAKDKVMLGTERKSLVMTEKEKLATAYHEAGHALVTWLLPGSTPVHKVTVIPRGRALGVTSYLPNEERHNESREQLITYITSAMGGRAAEKIVYDQLNTGAAQDIERATSLARKMVCEWGMSEKLGSLTFGKKDEMVFLGREIATHKDYSDRTAELIDEEVRGIVDGCYQRALELLKANQDKLHLLAKSLVEREILDGEEMDRLLKGETLGPPKGDGDKPGVTEAGAPEGAEADAEKPGANPLTGKGPKQLDAFA